MENVIKSKLNDVKKTLKSQTGENKDSKTKKVESNENVIKSKVNNVKERAFKKQEKIKIQRKRNGTERDCHQIKAKWRHEKKFKKTEENKDSKRKRNGVEGEHRQIEIK